MSLNRYVNRIQRLDRLIRHKGTGTPQQLAARLDISERWLYAFIDELRQELDCPIVYDRKRRSYVYTKRGKLLMGFRKELEHSDMSR